MKIFWKYLGFSSFIFGVFFIIFFILFIGVDIRHFVVGDNVAEYNSMISLFKNVFYFYFISLIIVFFIGIFISFSNYKKKNIFLKKINNINVENIKEIKLYINSGKKILIKTEKLKKIILYVLEKTGKKQFKKGELEGIYKEILFLNKTDLPKEKYEKIKIYLQQFIDEGGKVEVIKK